MTQNRDFDAIEQAIRQLESEKNILEQTEIANEPQRKAIKIVLIGSLEVVNSTIYHFQLIGYAEVGDWSRLLPSPNDNPLEVMRILVRRITVQ